MEKAERVKLLRALAAASNAYHDELRKRGYDISYGLNDFHKGSIIDLSKHCCADDRFVGTVSIVTSIKKEDK